MRYNFTNLPHAGIRNLSPYVPGKSIAEVAQEFGLHDVIKLASNENPFGCSPQVVSALQQINASTIAQYPSLTSTTLLQALSAKLNVSSAHLTISNGTDALLPLFIMCFALHANKKVLSHEYAFIAYKLYAQMLGVPYYATAVNADFQVEYQALIDAVKADTGLIFLPNPNNPTGVPVEKTAVINLLDNIPATTLLILDEAYVEFNQVAFDSIALISQYPNLVITRTFSKAYGLAGLRLGYAIAHPDITQILNRALPPFCLNQASLLAGPIALADQAFVDTTVQNNASEKQRLASWLDELHISYIPSQGNFIMLNCQVDANLVFTHLQQQGIIVRPLKPYGLNNYIRLTIGTPTQNNLFMQAFKELI